MTCQLRMIGVIEDWGSTAALGSYVDPDALPEKSANLRQANDPAQSVAGFFLSMI